jgi:hypothetical protein
VNSTNYADTFIAIAQDSTATGGVAPPGREIPSVGYLLYQRLIESPYAETSDDAIFAVFAQRMGIAAKHRAQARLDFFAKPQACLRASDLGKRYGWGIHHDGKQRIAIYGVETPAYARFVSGAATAPGAPQVTLKYAMRSKR